MTVSCHTSYSCSPVLIIRNLFFFFVFMIKSSSFQISLITFIFFPYPAKLDSGKQKYNALINLWRQVLCIAFYGFEKIDTLVDMVGCRSKVVAPVVVIEFVFIVYKTHI